VPNCLAGPQRHGFLQQPRIVSYLLAILLNVALLFSGCLPRWEKVTSPDLKEIARITSLTFPASARLVGSRLRTSLDSSLQAKVEMDRSELQSFIKSSPFAGKMSSNDRLGITNEALRERPAWWDPDSVGAPTAGEVVRDGGHEVIRILADTGHGDEAVVYLLWEGA
jgi:hypothetical protein